MNTMKDLESTTPYKSTIRALNRQLRVMNGLLRSNKLDWGAKQKLDIQIKELRGYRDELIREFETAKIDYTGDQTDQYLLELRDKKTRANIVGNQFKVKSLTGKILGSN